MKGNMKRLRQTKARLSSGKIHNRERAPIMRQREKRNPKNRRGKKESQKSEN